MVFEYDLDSAESIAPDNLSGGSKENYEKSESDNQCSEEDSKLDEGVSIFVFYWITLVIKWRNISVVLLRAYRARLNC
jgi:hypothetical protein